MENGSLDNNIRKYALINAIAHNGRANSKSVLGKILSDSPELRKNLLEIRSKIEFTVEEINKLSPKEQQKELDKLGGYTPEKKVEKKTLPALDVGRTFVMRFAPNPDGAIHIGNARPAVLCHEYKKRYRGKFILRFDDTDPKIKVPEKRFYKWIKDDLKWLKIKWDSEIVASKRLNIYYKYAEDLIKMEGAYVCTCENEKWKTLRDRGSSCSCRRTDIKTNIKKWKKMMASNKGKGYKEGEAVLRIRTDLEAKNPAVRDWPAFRIVDKPKHPLCKKRLWPLYNFASAIDDHLLKVTHIFRGQEHTTNEVKQRYLYQYFGWKYPVAIILGRFSMAGMVLSKSEIREGIKSGEFSGWDDLKVGTIRSLKRRGYQPQAIKDIIYDIGVKPSDITISTENLAAYNRRIIDKTAKRYFFIHHPKKIELDKLPFSKINVPVHPEDKNNFRTITVGKTIFVDKRDFERYRGLEVRLKDFCNVKLGEKSKYIGKEVRSIPKIHWVPEDHIPVRIFVTGKQIKGYGEVNLAKTKTNDIVQLERFGFVRIEKISGNNVIAIFSHE